MKINEATTKAEIEKCFDVMNALRPKLERETFVELILGMMTRGYHLIYIEDEGRVPCFCGYRFTEHLYWGKAIYIDDLSTLPGARKKGYASTLLDHVFEIARKNKCDEVHLDSGCGPNRYDAHRLYLKKGFNISSHHFAIQV